MSVGIFNGQLRGNGLSFDAGVDVLTEASNASSLTPTITGSVSNPTVTYTQQNARYQSLGNIVFWSFFISISNISGGSGDVRIGGFPVASGNLPHPGSGTLIIQSINLPAQVLYTVTVKPTNVLYSEIVFVLDNATKTKMQISQLTNTSTFEANGFYFFGV